MKKKRYLPEAFLGHARMGLYIKWTSTGNIVRLMLADSGSVYSCNPAEGFLLVPLRSRYNCTIVSKQEAMAAFKLNS